jgi:hypothetical protein
VENGPYAGSSKESIREEEWPKTGRLDGRSEAAKIWTFNASCKKRRKTRRVGLFRPRLWIMAAELAVDILALPRSHPIQAKEGLPCLASAVSVPRSKIQDLSPSSLWVLAVLQKSLFDGRKRECDIVQLHKKLGGIRTWRA